MKINLNHMRHLRIYKIPIMEAYMFLNVLYGFKKTHSNLHDIFMRKSLINLHVAFFI